MYTGSGFFTNTFKVFGHVSEHFRVFLNAFLEQSHEIDFIFTGEFFRIRENFSLFIDFFSFDTLQNHHSGISSIIDNYSRALISWPLQSFESAVPIFFHIFIFPCKNIGGLCGSNSCSGLILCGIYIAAAPSYLRSELL